MQIPPSRTVGTHRHLHPSSTAVTLLKVEPSMDDIVSCSVQQQSKILGRELTEAETATIAATMKDLLQPTPSSRPAPSPWYQWALGWVTATAGVTEDSFSQRSAPAGQGKLPSWWSGLTPPVGHTMATEAVLIGVSSAELQKRIPHHHVTGCERYMPHHFLNLQPPLNPSATQAALAPAAVVASGQGHSSRPLLPLSSGGLPWWWKPPTHLAGACAAASTTRPATPHTTPHATPHAAPHAAPYAVAPNGVLLHMRVDTRAAKKIKAVAIQPLVETATTWPVASSMMRVFLGNCIH
uniref:Uncharacterized protein n=1 Tax=Haptolina ericina TaxID=156174 RepID=A0A7S3ALL1_9EUKA